MTQEDKKINENKINEYRQHLFHITNQRQQLQIQQNILETTIKELEECKEKKVYKGIGNIFILSDKDEVLKNTKEMIETTTLKLKTLEKQESEIIKKLNELGRKTEETKEKTSTKKNDDETDTAIA
jgi:prefoldin beta subunit